MKHSKVYDNIIILYNHVFFPMSVTCFCELWCQVSLTFMSTDGGFCLGCVRSLSGVKVMNDNQWYRCYDASLFCSNCTLLLSACDKISIIKWFQPESLPQLYSFLLIQQNGKGALHCRCTACTYTCLLLGNGTFNCNQSGLKSISLR